MGCACIVDPLSGDRIWDHKVKCSTTFLRETEAIGMFYWYPKLNVPHQIIPSKSASKAVRANIDTVLSKQSKGYYSN